MIRLAVSGADKELLTQVTQRLKGGAAAVWSGDPVDANFKDCDAVAFCGTSEVAAPQVELALKAGKHVLLNAQSVFAEPTLVSLSTAAQAANRQFAVINPDRFLPSRLLVHQELVSGKLGEPGLVRMHRWESPATGTPAILPGSLLLDLDLACWLLGKSPNLVFAITPIEALPTNSRRCIQIHLGFPKNAMGMMTYASGLASGESYELLHVIGSAGAAYVDEQANRQLHYGSGGLPRVVKAPEKVRQMASLLQDFVDGLVGGRDFSPSVAAWQLVLAIAGATCRSLETRQAVAWEGI